MEFCDLPRHRLIRSLMAKQTEKVADAAIVLWEQLSTQIISIVGEDGFNALYLRSLFLGRSTFPGLPAIPLPPHKGHRFAELKISF
jgi:hypothetical protein